MNIIEREKQKRLGVKAKRQMAFVRNNPVANENQRFSLQMKCQIKGCPDKVVAMKNKIPVCDRHT